MRAGDSSANTSERIVIRESPENGVPGVEEKAAGRERGLTKADCSVDCVDHEKHLAIVTLHNQHTEGVGRGALDRPGRHHLGIQVRKPLQLPR